MKCNVLYFGMIAEAVQKNSEELIFEKQISVLDLKELLIEKYSSLQKMSFQIALNQKIASESVTLEGDNEIAILPPFAGG